MGKMEEYQSLEIDFPYTKGDIYGERISLLEAVQLSLRMYHVKAFKGKKRKETLLRCMFTVNKALDEEENYQEKTLQMIEKAKRTYLLLPYDILRKIDDMEDIYFGEYGKEIYAQLKRWFFTERERLRAAMIGRTQK
ncbi:MAG: hypothetical protein E7355_02320 [Clostridiales bacterium]|nr:hypothetical protein [Clostridiales bacterium]